MEGARALTTADFDGDGDLEILAGGGDDRGTVAWLERKPSESEFISHTASRAKPDARDVFPADIDGDAWPDLVSASQDDHAIAWYRNNAAAVPNFRRHVIVEDPAPDDPDVNGFADRPIAVYAADMDRDGDIDVLGASYDDDDITLWENNGTGGGWAETTIDGDFGGTLSVYAADIGNAYAKLSQEMYGYMETGNLTSV